MFKIICVTARELSRENFFAQTEKICAGGIDRLILREKDMSDMGYENLAARVMEICGKYNTSLSLHSRLKSARDLGVNSVHLSYNAFMGEDTRDFDTVGVSVHSAGEATAAADNCPSYIIAGHIFATDCKRGVPPRGTDFLADIVRSVSNFNIPVYAIGGVTPENAALCAEAGAAGVCIMSGLMQSEEPGELIKRIRDRLDDSL